MEYIYMFLLGIFMLWCFGCYLWLMSKYESVEIVSIAILVAIVAGAIGYIPFNVIKFIIDKQ